MRKSLLLIFFYTFGNLYAQDTLFKSPVDEVMKLKILDDNAQEVSTASQKIEDIGDVPANIMVISASQIRERGYEDVSDLLKDLPNIDVTENARAFGEYYTIRGINGNDRFLVMVNGRKLNAISGTYLSIGNSVSVRLAKRVEIVYGASSIVYGSDAFSAVINIITEEPTTPKKFVGQLSYGNFNAVNAFIQNSLNISNKLKFNVFGRLYNSDGFSPKAEGIYANTANYPNPFNNKFAQAISDHNLLVEARYKNFQAGIYRQYFSEGNSWGISPAVYLMTKESVWAVHHNIMWLNYQKTFKNGGTFYTDLSYNYHFQDEESKFPKFAIANDVNSAVSYQYMTGKDQSVRFLAHYSQKFLKKIDFIGGIQVDNAYIVPAYANDQVLGSPLKYIGNAADEIDKKLTINEQKLGIFGQLHYDLSKKINITAALRYDYSKQFDDVFNPRLALIFKPTNNIFAKIIYGRAFQAPSFFYQYEQFSNATSIMIPNALQDFKLDNQHIETTEFDLTYRKNNNSLNLNIFYNIANELIERRTYTTSVFNPFANKNTIGFRNENNGEQVSYGLSLRSEWQIHPKINFWGHYSFIKASFLYGKDLVKRDLPRISEHKIYVGFTFQKILDMFDLYFSYKWLSDITPIASSTSGKIEGHSYLNTNLSFYKIRFVRFFGQSQLMLGNKNHVGLFDGGIYTPTIPQAAWQGRIGIEVNF